MRDDRYLRIGKRVDDRCEGHLQPSCDRRKKMRLLMNGHVSTDVDMFHVLKGEDNEVT